jgi:hypothetical protein
MLVTVVLNFLLATLGTLAIFLISVRLQGIRGFSAPFFVIIAGVVCATASAIIMTASASFGYTWAIIGYVPTIVILVLYVISEAQDVMETRARDRLPKQAKGESNGGK